MPNIITQKFITPWPSHERRLAQIARDIGFTQISVSSEISGLVKFVPRADTTVADAYLSPILRNYIDGFTRGFEHADRDPGRAEPDPGPRANDARRLGVAENTPPQLLFMQSNGGLADAHHFRGKDSILSGPAGGIVGAARTAARAGFERIITFDMGGTSTDVAHYAGEYERSFESLVAGVRLRAPMLHIHTVAAGGGSICRLDGTRLRVGPESAGANPGPACYRRGGPHTITRINIPGSIVLQSLFLQDLKIFTEKHYKVLCGCAGWHSLLKLPVPALFIL